MHSVLVVDDDSALRHLVRRWSESFGFETHEAETAEQALDFLDYHAFEIAVCDVTMPDASGVWLASQIRDEHPDTAIIMATGRHDMELAVASLRNDVVDYLLKPFTRERLGEALALGRDWHNSVAGVEQFQHALEDRLRTRRASVAASLAEVQATCEAALDGLLKMMQLHIRDGRGHATRVAALAIALADELGLRGDLIETIERGALLHDIGKLDMPSSILCKPAMLDDDEWRVMRTHPQVGYDLLKNQPRFTEAAEIVLSHHEAYDGSGYPRGLAGEAIPLGGRILAIADSYDSMTHPHTQRPPMAPMMALREIERCRGRQFDPACAEALADVLIHTAEGRAA